MPLVLSRRLVILALIPLAAFAFRAHGDEAAPPKEFALPEPLQPLFKGTTSLNPQGTVALDKQEGRVLLKTRVCLREGLLEMLLCKSRTKEHESILTVDSDAYVIHAGLLAIGAKSGTPVRFQPDFQPPQGDALEVWLNWVDESGKAQRIEAQQWVRGLTRRYYVEKIGPLPQGLKLPKESDLKYDAAEQELIWFGPMTDAKRDELLKLSTGEAYQKAIRAMHADSQVRGMEADFVFAGSGFHESQDGTKWYQAEAGNLICVANFGDAMIDVSIRSSDVNSEASFEPWTERVPPLGTPVVVELRPAAMDDDKQAAQKPDAPAQP
ncbi:MAG: hypothetical protein KF774_06200 [Planctomyces sp.]|nr:hypothetical protein [Planctomyces sp.]